MKDFVEILAGVIELFPFERQRKGKRWTTTEKVILLIIILLVISFIVAIIIAIKQE